MTAFGTQALPPNDTASGLRHPSHGAALTKNHPEGMQGVMQARLRCLLMVWASSSCGLGYLILSAPCLLSRSPGCHVLRA